METAMNKHDQPRDDMFDDMLDACFGSAVFVNETRIDEALKARLLARGEAMNDAGMANQPLQTQRKAKKAA
jgi:hypothetical protein